MVTRSCCRFLIIMIMWALLLLLWWWWWRIASLFSLLCRHSSSLSIKPCLIPPSSSFLFQLQNDQRECEKGLFGETTKADWVCLSVTEETLPMDLHFQKKGIKPEKRTCQTCKIHRGKGAWMTNLSICLTIKNATGRAKCQFWVWQYT